MTNEEIDFYAWQKEYEKTNPPRRSPVDDDEGAYLRSLRRKAINVRHEEGTWTPYFHFYPRIAGYYTDISTGMAFFRIARVGKVTPF